MVKTLARLPDVLSVELVDSQGNGLTVHNR